MKLITFIALGVLAWAGIVCAGELPAGAVSPELVEEYMDKPFGQWQLTVTSLLVGAMFVMRVVNYLKANGGIKSIGSAIWCGGLGGANRVEVKVSDTLSGKDIIRMSELSMSEDRAIEKERDIKKREARIHDASLDLARTALKEKVKRINSNPLKGLTTPSNTKTK